VAINTMSDCRRFSLLANAVAGRKINVAPGDGPTHTDGRTIFMPPEVKGPPDDAVVGLVVQAGLLSAGSLDPSLLARLMGRQTQARRYLTLEAQRCVVRREICAPPRVRERVLDHWSGPASTSAGESLSRALKDHRIPGAPELFGTLRPGLVLREVALGRGKALQEGDRLDSVEQPSIEEIGDEEDSDDSGILKMFTSPFQRESAMARFLREHILRSGTRPKSDDSDGGQELAVNRLQAVGNVGPHGQRVDGAAPPRQGAAVPIGAFTYPEWDHRHGSYLRDWCSVAEYDPSPATSEGPSVFGRDADLERRLARLGLALRRHGRRSDGDALDFRALLDFAESRRLGETPTELIHEARLLTGHELGVVVLLDASGSTATRESGRISIWHDQRRLVANLVAALEAVGERVAAYGFRSDGRHDVRFLRVKEFDDRFDGAARARLAALEPSGFTRLGAAVRHATYLAAERSGASRQLVMVVSDGLPFETDYRDRHAEEDSRRAFAEGQDRGVASVCVSVGASVDPAVLARVWGGTDYVRLDRVEELSTHVEVLLRSALQRALARSHGCVARTPMRRRR
jgi:Mg-chelatase subunit ChlD